jgi:hypothetical protein
MVVGMEVYAVSGIRWSRSVAVHDFDAAHDYLTLRLPDEKAAKLVKRLGKAKATTRRANDVARACGREVLPLTDPGVKHTLRKVLDGERLSPILVVVFDGHAEVADGWHRLSLTYNLDPFADVPLRIATL